MIKVGLVNIFANILADIEIYMPYLFFDLYYHFL